MYINVFHERNVIYVNVNAQIVCSMISKTSCMKEVRKKDTKKEERGAHEWSYLGL